MNKIICEMKKEHVMKCVEMYVEVNNAEPWNDEWTFETAHKRLNNIYNSPNFTGVVYIENSAVLGAIFGNCEQFYDGMHYNLKEMFVSSELQKTGIGSKMLKVLEEQLKRYDVNTIILLTSKGNGTNKFYIKNGFDELERLAIMSKGLSQET